MSDSPAKGGTYPTYWVENRKFKKGKMSFDTEPQDEVQNCNSKFKIDKIFMSLQGVLVLILNFSF